MATWTRTYRDPVRTVMGIWTVVGAVCFVVAVSAVALILVVSVLVADHPPIPWAIAPIVASTALPVTLMWRLHRTALVTSSTGVRVRWPIKTRTVGWSEVNRFRFGVDVRAVDRLWVDLVDGRSIRTPVQRVRRASEVRFDGGTWLLPDAAAELLHSLDQELEARRATA